MWEEIHNRGRTKKDRWRTREDEESEKTKETEQTRSGERGNERDNKRERDIYKQDNDRHKREDQRMERALGREGETIGVGGVGGRRIPEAKQETELRARNSLAHRYRNLPRVPER